MIDGYEAPHYTARPEKSLSVEPPDLLYLIRMRVDTPGSLFQGNFENGVDSLSSLRITHSNSHQHSFFVTKDFSPYSETLRCVAGARL